MQHDLDTNSCFFNKSHVCSLQPLPVLTNICLTTVGKECFTRSDFIDPNSKQIKTMSLNHIRKEVMETLQTLQSLYPTGGGRTTAECFRSSHDCIFLRLSDISTTEIRVENSQNIQWLYFKAELFLTLNVLVTITRVPELS